MITDLHGQPLGKYLSVAKFLSGLPKAHAFSDLALAGDLGGTPHLTFWHPFERPCSETSLRKSTFRRVLWILSTLRRPMLLVSLCKWMAPLLISVRERNSHVSVRP